MSKFFIKLLSFLKRIFKKLYIEGIYRLILLPLNKKYYQTPVNKEKPENIFFINTTVDTGGAPKVSYDMLMKSLKKKGYKTKILVRNNDRAEKNEVIEIEKNNPEDQKIFKKFEGKYGWLDFFALPSLKIKSLPEFKNSDILHLNNLHGGYLSPFALPELSASKPTVWTLHDEQSFTGHCAFSYECKKWQSGCGNCHDLHYYPRIEVDSTSFLWKTKKTIYKNSYLTIVCPSKWLKDRATKSILQSCDIRHIYHGINEKIFIPYNKTNIRKELDLPLNKKILLFSSNAGTKNPQKGGLYIQGVYDYFKNNENIILISIGGDKYIREENCINLPYIHTEIEMAKYYSAADLFIYPTLADTFGLVVAESMSCSVPVITFNNGPMPELIEHMETGYLANYKNSQDFIKGIEVFLKDDELRQKAGIKARQVIEKKFTLDRMINNYINLYNEIYEQRKTKK